MEQLSIVSISFLLSPIAHILYILIVWSEIFGLIWDFFFFFQPRQEDEIQERARINRKKTHTRGKWARTSEKRAHTNEKRWRTRVWTLDSCIVRDMIEGKTWILILSLFLFYKWGSSLADKRYQFAPIKVSCMEHKWANLSLIGLSLGEMAVVYTTSVISP